MKRERENTERRAYPLTWPLGKVPTPPSRRRAARFQATFVRAWNDLLDELDRLHAENVIVSTNAQLRPDGKPELRAAAQVHEPGVAVYFELHGRQYALACDVYTELRWNLRALGVTVEALRTIERHGSIELMEQAFTGFLALPAAGEARGARPWTQAVEAAAATYAQPWTQVLSLTEAATAKDIERAYRRLAATAHPDRGGSHDAFVRLQAARMQAEDHVARRLYAAAVANG